MPSNPKDNMRTAIDNFVKRLDRKAFVHLFIWATVLVIVAGLGIGAIIGRYILPVEAEGQSYAWEIEGAKAALRADGVECEWQEPSDGSSSWWCVDGNDPNLGLFTIVPHPTDTQMTEETIVDLSALGLDAPERDRDVAAIWTSEVGVSFPTSTPHRLGNLMAACMASKNCMETRAGSVPKAATGDMPLGDDTSVRPPGDVHEFTPESLKTSTDVWILGNGGDCYNGWQSAGSGMEYCTDVSSGLVYIVVTKPDYDVMASMGTNRSNDPMKLNGSTGNYVMWNSSAGLIVPADSTALIDEFTDTCAAEDECLLMGPGDDGPVIVGGRH